MKETEQQAEPKTAKRRGRAQQDLTGQKFGRLTVLAMIPGHDGIPAKVQCRCECGNIITAATGNVKRGNTRSCGCMPHARKTKYARTDEATVVRANKKGRQGPKPRNLDGQKFGRLTVLRFAGYDKNDHAVYECQCECGSKKLIRGNSLTTGKTKSCGCQRVIAGKDNVTHGDSRKNSPYAPIYHTWALMRDRCHNPNNEYYKDYGGRGIRVCDEWSHYETFKDWSLSHGWEPGLSIDRVDVDGDYMPGNCRWTDSRTQANNTRRSVRVRWNGVNMSAYDWANMLSLPFEACKELLKTGANPCLVRGYVEAQMMGISETPQEVPSYSDNGDMASDDLTGRAFGYLTVIGKPYQNEKKVRFVECRCVCGKTKPVRVSSLRSGKTKSCGCMKGELVSRKVTKHQDSQPNARYFNLYRIWVTMRHRTRMENYEDTGEQVGVCDEWDSWVAFRDWSLAHGYRQDMRLTRLDVSKPFSPDNCEWRVVDELGRLLGPRD